MDSYGRVIKLVHMGNATRKKRAIFFIDKRNEPEFKIFWYSVIPINSPLLFQKLSFIVTINGAPTKRKFPNKNGIKNKMATLSYLLFFTFISPFY